MTACPPDASPIDVAVIGGGPAGLMAAERLQAHQHGVVSLVSRCEKLGLVERQPGREDRRAVEVHLTAAGERLVARIAERHRQELKQLEAVFPQVAGLGMSAAAQRFAIGSVDEARAYLAHPVLGPYRVNLTFRRAR